MRMKKKSWKDVLGRAKVLFERHFADDQMVKRAKADMDEIDPEIKDMVKEWGSDKTKSTKIMKADGFIAKVTTRESWSVTEHVEEVLDDIGVLDSCYDEPKLNRKKIEANLIALDLCEEEKKKIREKIFEKKETMSLKVEKE